MQSIEEFDLDKMVEKAHVNLNDSYLHYTQPPTRLAKEFVEIKLQVCIFQYDVTVEMAGLLRNKPTGFAASVALEGLVLRLFEFESTLGGTVLPRLLALADARDIEIESGAVQDLKRKWKEEFRTLKSWHHVRNQAAGHYGRDLRKQVEALEPLTVDAVMGVAVGFLHFAQSLFRIMRDAGQGVVSDDRPLERVHKQKCEGNIESQAEISQLTRA